MMTWWRTCLCQSTLIQKGTSTWLLTCLHSLSGQIWGQDSVVPMVRGAVSLYLAVPDSAHQNQLSGAHRDIDFFAPTKKLENDAECVKVASTFPVGVEVSQKTIFFEKKALPPTLAVILSFSPQDIKTTHLKVLNRILFTSSLLFWHRSRMTTYII